MYRGSIIIIKHNPRCVKGFLEIHPRRRDVGRDGTSRPTLSKRITRVIIGLL